MLTIPSDFLMHIRVMVHTLTEHISAYFPNPWASQETESIDGNHNATVSELLQLAGELEYVWQHSQKLTHQIYRAHKLLQTGEFNYRLINDNYCQDNFNEDNIYLELSKAGQPLATLEPSAMVTMELIAIVAPTGKPK